MVCAGLSVESESVLTEDVVLVGSAVADGVKLPEVAGSAGTCRVVAGVVLPEVAGTVGAVLVIVGVAAAGVAPPAVAGFAGIV